MTMTTTTTNAQMESAVYIEGRKLAKLVVGFVGLCKRIVPTSSSCDNGFRSAKILDDVERFRKTGELTNPNFTASQIANTLAVWATQIEHDVSQMWMNDIQGADTSQDSKRMFLLNDAIEKKKELFASISGFIKLALQVRSSSTAR